MTEEKEPRYFRLSNFIIKKLYERRLEEYKARIEELRDPRIIYVSDLLYCPLKRKFRMEYPELSFAFEPNMILGELVHSGLQQELKELGFEIEKEIQEKIIVENEEYILKGRIDAFSKDLIIEIKTSKNSLGLPYPHHERQLRIYMAMTGVRKGLLIYVTNDRLVEFPVYDSGIDLGELLQQYLKEEQAPLWDWECRVCVFNKFCPYRIDK